MVILPQTTHRFKAILIKISTVFSVFAEIEKPNLKFILLQRTPFSQNILMKTKLEDSDFLISKLTIRLSNVSQT